MSGYGYAGANPLREVDPEGMQANPLDGIEADARQIYEGLKESARQFWEGARQFGQALEESVTGAAQTIERRVEQTREGIARAARNLAQGSSGRPASRSIEDLLEGANYEGKKNQAHQYRYPLGTYHDASQDILSIAIPGTLRPRANGTITAELPDGRMINLHISSREPGNPTIGIPAGEGRSEIKIRYGPRRPKP